LQRMQSNWRWPFRRGVPGKPRVTVASRIPVLTYHAAHAHGYDYLGNDHLALEQDLEVIRRLNVRVAKLQDVVDFVLGRGKAELHEGRWVALTFDFGCLKSFYRLLVESAEAGGPGLPAPTAVSFAIADPDARDELDRACFAGRGHWRDFWWHEATETGVLAFANHSWDHAHGSLAVIRQREQRKGTFLGIDNEEDANVQVLAAQRYIWFRTAGLALPFFAYPYGEAPDYLRREYFPDHEERHGIRAAFGTQGDYATAGADRWHIPRFVCGQHWRSPDELASILDRSVRAL
jgi:hypothetical protein